MVAVVSARRLLHRPTNKARSTGHKHAIDAGGELDAHQIVKTPMSPLEVSGSSTRIEGSISAYWWNAAA